MHKLAPKKRKKIFLTAKQNEFVRMLKEHKLKRLNMQ